MRAISRKLTARPNQVTRKKCSIRSKIVSHSIRQDGSGWCEGRRKTSDIFIQAGQATRSIPQKQSNIYLELLLRSGESYALLPPPRRARVARQSQRGLLR